MELKPSVDVVMDSSSDRNDLHPVLQLNKLTLKDAGEITVRATNSEGEVSSAARLTIKGKTHYPQRFSDAELG